MTTRRTDVSVSRRATSRRTAVAGLGAGGLGLVLGARPPLTAAQEATPTGMSQTAHAVVGAWRWTTTPEDPIPSTYAIFHDDGTYHEVAGGHTGIGIWRATGERTAEIGYVYQDIKRFSVAFEPGTVVVRATVEVTATGDAASAVSSIEAWALNGAKAFQVDGLAGSLTRLTLESLESLAFPSRKWPAPRGTPIVATPAP